jgi:hypothetical protein
VNALARRDVGDYLNRHFVSAFQKIATFQINGRLKQGGNVAGYFCTPDGRVLHAVAGPVDGGTFLREARWANETFQLAQLEKRTPAEVAAFFRKAHADRLQREQNLTLPEDRLPRPDAVTPRLLEQVIAENAHLALDNQGKVQLLLAVAAMPRLDQVYRVVFEEILNEKVSTDPVAVNGR